VKHTTFLTDAQFSQTHKSVLLSSFKKHEENYDKDLYFLFVFGTYIKPGLNTNAVSTKNLHLCTK